MAEMVTPEEFVRRLFTTTEASRKMVDEVIRRTPWWKLRTLRQLVALKQRLTIEAARLKQQGA